MTGVVTSMHCKGFLETVNCQPLLFLFCFLSSSAYVYQHFKAKSNLVRKICLLSRLMYVAVHIYYTWCDIILIFKLYRKTRLTHRSSLHSLKIRMTSHLCNKYEQITLSYLRVGGMLLKLFKALVTRYVLSYHQVFLYLDFCSRF